MACQYKMTILSIFCDFDFHNITFYWSYFKEILSLSVTWSSEYYSLLMIFCTNSVNFVLLLSEHFILFCPHFGTMKEVFVRSLLYCFLVDIPCFWSEFEVFAIIIVPVLEPFLKFSQGVSHTVSWLLLSPFWKLFYVFARHFWNIFLIIIMTFFWVAPIFFAKVSLSIYPK